MTYLYVAIILAVFVIGLAVLGVLHKKDKSFTVRVMLALLIGLIFGAVIQTVFGRGHEVTLMARDWINIVGSGFTRLLQFLVVPIVLVSILNAITKATGGSRAAKSGLKIIGVLLVTTAVAAFIGFLGVQLFSLDASGLLSGASTDREPTNIPTAMLNIFPSNLFSALSANSALPIVFIAALLGFTFLQIRKDNEEMGTRLIGGVDTVNEVVMYVTDFVIGLTPYGVFAIMTRVAATSDVESIMNLFTFVLAAYVAMLAMFVVQLVILATRGVNPITYLKKAGNTILFAFTSRSSAAALPMTIKTQTDDFGVNPMHANLAGSFGTSIGQNGCAGVYPAMVATMAAAALGWNVWSPGFIIPMVIYAAITSIGIAGVGGGATNATILLLSLLGLPIELVAILISVEFVIDMGRTALNVSGSIVAGIAVARNEGEIDDDILHGRKTVKHAAK